MLTGSPATGPCPTATNDSQAISYTFQNTPWVPWVYAEKVVSTLFTIQEFIIAGVYLTQAFRILRPESEYRNDASRPVLHRLIAANIFIIVLDMVFLGFEWAQLWGIWCAFKGFTYSVKLRIEFAILNQLRRAVQGYDFRSIGTKQRYTNKPRVEPSTQNSSADSEATMPHTDECPCRQSAYQPSSYPPSAYQPKRGAGSRQFGNQSELSSLDDEHSLQLQNSRY